MKKITLLKGARVSLAAIATSALVLMPFAADVPLAFATAAPVVTSISPTNGTTAGGTSVTISGTSLASATAVHFGANTATITGNGPTSIIATSPAGSVGTVDVTVTTPSGTSATSSNDHFTYVAPTPAPTVASVSPTSGTTAGGTTVTVMGSNFTGVTDIKFGSTSATGVVVASSTSLTAVSPAESAGMVDMTVTTSGGGTSATSSNDHFTYVAPGAPVISNITASSTGTTSEDIGWMTDLPSTSQVEYGTTTSYGSMSALNSTLTTSHLVSLSGLSEATLYHFAVMSGTGVATSTSADNSFVTESTASTTPLHVDGITAVSTNATADDTYVHGWSWVMHLTVPDNESAFRMKFSDWTGSAGTFPTANDVRIFSPQSSNATDESTAITETDNNYGGWLYLTGDTATSTPGRQIDVTIEVRIPSGTTAGSYSTTFGAQSVPTSATSTTP